MTDPMRIDSSTLAAERRQGLLDMSVVGRHLCVGDVELDRHRRHIEVPGQRGTVAERYERALHVADGATSLAEDALQRHRVNDGAASPDSVSSARAIARSGAPAT